MSVQVSVYNEGYAGMTVALPSVVKKKTADLEKRLRVVRRTVRDLAPAELDRAAGGRPCMYTLCIAYTAAAVN